MINKKSLFVCMSDLPFPARKNGISIRYYPILEHAAQKFDIHLLVIANESIDKEDLAEAKKFCKKISVYVRKPQPVKLGTKLVKRMASLFPFTTPFEKIYYDEKEIAHYIAKETNNIIYDTALCVLITHLHLVQQLVKAKCYSLDVIDSPYSTSIRNCGNSPLKVYDAVLMKQWERRAIKSVDYACYISPLDRKLGAGENINNDKVGVIPNGIFLDDFSQEKLNFNGKTIGYLGHMGYPPNIKAALRLYKIFVSISKEIPDIKLVIIGRTPAPEIVALAKNKNVLVTGTVDNIWQYIHGIDIFVFPMEIGSGQQNKLLEVMQAGKAVISTSLGNSGIGAHHTTEILIANSDEEIAASIIELAEDEKKCCALGENGHTFIKNKYSWPSIFKTIDNTLLANK